MALSSIVETLRNWLRGPAGPPGPPGPMGMTGEPGLPFEGSVQYSALCNEYHRLQRRQADLNKIVEFLSATVQRHEDDIRKTGENCGHNFAKINALKSRLSDLFKQIGSVDSALEEYGDWLQDLDDASQADEKSLEEIRDSIGVLHKQIQNCVQPASKPMIGENIRWSGRVYGVCTSPVDQAAQKAAVNTESMMEEKARLLEEFIRRKEEARSRVEHVIHFHCMWCGKLQSFPAGSVFTPDSLKLCPECRVLQERSIKEAEKALWLHTTCRPGPCNCCGNDLAPDENQCCGNCQHEKGQNNEM